MNSRNRLLSHRTVATVFAVCLTFMAAPALAAGSTHGPTAPGGDWTEPEHRDMGDMAIFGGPGAFIGPLGDSEMDPEDMEIAPGADVSLNFHLGRNVALTGRSGATWHGATVTVPTLGGIRLQAPFDESTFAIGPELGYLWAFNPGDEESEPVGYLTGAIRASYEYTLETGWTLGADLSIHQIARVGTLGRAGVKLGYEF